MWGVRFREAANVALAPGQADAVEVFADRDGVAAGGAQEIAEFGHGHGGAVGEPVADAAAELDVRIGVEVEPGVDLGDPLLVAEQGEQIGDDRSREVRRRRRARPASGGLIPPARIASASSCLSRRSAWLSRGSWPDSATVRASAMTLP